MLIWFAVLSVAGVALVFRDPRLDHRLVAVGALVPDVVDGLFRWGRIGPAHTLLGAVAALSTVMFVTVGRRPLRKRLLAIPIGWFAHLVLDPSWTLTKVFWWPALGAVLPGRLPVLDRPIVVTLAMEAIGVALGVLVWQRCGLRDPRRRRAFFRTGALEWRPRRRAR
jgi:apolipoprotein N-acyltransferase